MENINSVSAGTGNDSYVFTIEHVNSLDLPRTMVKIHDNDVSVMIDSGSSINVIDETTYNKLDPQAKLKYDHITVKAYGSHNPLTIKGSFTSHLQSKDRITCAKVYVASGSSSLLLSYETSVDLGLLTITNHVKANHTQTIIGEYQDVSQSIGKLKGTQVKLHIDQSVKPVQQTHRRIPFYVRKQVEAELKNLEEQDIIELVTGPKPWVSLIVVAPKPKSPSQIRLCIDMREENHAIQRERHISPTLDDLIHDLNGATVFSHLDLRSDYHQLELHPDSRYITTFSTHLGLRRYKRLIF